ncbi:hypothetical protein [Neobacillus kokaensis]|uniref:Uncharacterized protein n=1 Tax=Neobacillus kokaensis TaxID=2759023 RepID=A0ABQ3N2F4_9BACI|nr:hypothetical protein [Neobacillus kokaensis]GHH99125.1 hypothetical protein AM1BK_26680 [Neobacillus kokaensis]
MKLSTFISVLGLLLTLGFVAYLDSPYSFMNINYSYSADQPVIAQPASIQPAEEEPELVEKLEKIEKVDGYIVETYQEYEIYKDPNGNVTEEIPTSKMETLKYWDQSEYSPSVFE